MQENALALLLLFISQIFFHKSYHLVEPFLVKDFFTSASARCPVTKFLLLSRAFYWRCIFCSIESKDILSHYLFTCNQKAIARRLLQSKLALSNFPTDKLSNIKLFFGTVLGKKKWTRCFSDYLADFGSRNQVQESEVELYISVIQNPGPAEMLFSFLFLVLVFLFLFILFFIFTWL